MSGIAILVVSIVVLALGYVFYGGWLAKQWGVDPSRKTPAYEMEDGVDYVPAKAPVLLGHHFASIAGAGPINGPIQAALFGWVPVLLWILIGGIFIGAVQDFSALFVSVRNKGMSIGEVMEVHLNHKSKVMFSVFTWLVMLLVDAAFADIVAKTFYYVASVTAAYRRALDAYLADPLNDNFELPAEVYEELTRTSHRHYSPGFYFGREQARQATDSATYIREWEFVGTVDGWENGVASCQQRGKWSLGDTLEALCPDGRSIPLNPEWIENEAGERVESTPHAMEKYTIPTPELPPMSLLRRKTV